MSVELRIREGNVECDWGVIEHSDPRPDRQEVGPLMLAVGWCIGGRLDKGPIPDDRYGLVNVKMEDADRLFLQIDTAEQRWTWELFEAHWEDGQGPKNMLVGRWPD